MKHPRIEEILAHVENMWSHDLVFDQPDDTILRQEFVTYRKIDSKIVRETVIRIFYGLDDYQDSTETVVISYDS